MTVHFELLKTALAELGAEFKPNELAYLALTQKVEHAIRDKLAFWLHRKGQNNFLICREWTRNKKRVDLVILNEEKPVLLLEAKAVYSFDVLKKNGHKYHDFPQLIADDANAAKNIGNADVFTLLLVTHPASSPEEKFHDAVKYAKDIEKFYDSSRLSKIIENNKADNLTNKTIQDASSDQMKEPHPNNPIIGEWNGGQAFGVNLSVIYLLYGPYFRDDSVSV